MCFGRSGLGSLPFPRIDRQGRLWENPGDQNCYQRADEVLSLGQNIHRVHLARQ